MKYDYEFAIDTYGHIVSDGMLLGSARQRGVVENLEGLELELARLWLEVHEVAQRASPALPLRGVRAYRRRSAVQDAPPSKRWGAGSQRGEEQGRVSLEFAVPGTWRDRIDPYLRNEGLIWIGQAVASTYTYNVMVDSEEDARAALAAFGKAML